MARTFKTGIVITGDAKSGVDALKMTDKELRQVNNSARKASKGTAVLTGAFSSMARYLPAISAGIAADPSQN